MGETCIWTIYDRPLDYPEHIVMRRWYVSGDKTRPGPCEIFDTVQEARSRLPLGLTNLRRRAEDDKTIIESWV